MAVACVSVDLDSIENYCAIHGLPESILSSQARDAVLKKALPRFLELFDEWGLSATFFAVGRDLAAHTGAPALQNAAAHGHEIANHSFSHDYALTRRAASEIARDVERGQAAIAEWTGKRPVGFRAPGYTLTAPLLQALCTAGYHYDASVFPSAPYWAAKAAAMGALCVLGRPSRAILDRPRVLLAPRLPYRPDLLEPYQPGRASLVELPITVEPRSRIPLLGAVVTALPARVFAELFRAVKRLPYLSLELHGIDLLDAADLGSPRLARAQRDLGIGWPTKRVRLGQALRHLVGDFETMTLQDAAEKLAID